MYKTRHPDESDIEQILAVEFERYKTLYKENPKKRNQIEETFRKRIRIGSDWAWVLEDQGKILGWISAQPTNEEPESFLSWELSTNNGTLEGKYNPAGRNIYVVNLDVLHEATKNSGQYQLMAVLGAKLVRDKKEKVVFESRMPGFRDWVYKDRKISKNDWRGFRQDQRQRLAEEYASLTVMRDGKEVLKDGLLRFYESGGFTFVKVYPNAFDDDESLSFGVLCVGYNPVPKWLRVLPINLLISAIFALLGKNQRLFERFVG